MPSTTGLNHGVFVQITASPYQAPTSFAARPERPADAMADRAAEARRFLDDHGYTEAWWKTVVKDNAGVATTFEKLGTETTARLLEHGYVLTLINLYVILGLGSLGSLDRERFRRLALGQSD